MEESAICQEFQKVVEIIKPKEYLEAREFILLVVNLEIGKKMIQFVWVDSLKKQRVYNGANLQLT